MEEHFKNVVIEAARLVNAPCDQEEKERIKQDIAKIQQLNDGFRKITIFLLEFFRDTKYRDSLFTLDNMIEMIQKDPIIGQIKDVKKNEIKFILETLIDNENLGRITMDSVTSYGLNSSVTLGKRIEK